MSRCVLSRLLQFRGTALDQAMLGHSVGGQTHQDLTKSLQQFLVSKKAQNAFSRVDRLEFLPSGHPTPYANSPVKMQSGHAISSPQFHAQQIAIVADAIHRQALCLDMGCGTGFLSAVMLELGAAHVLAIDSDPEMCEQAEKNLKKYGGQVEVRLANQVSSGTLFDAIVVAPFFVNEREAQDFLTNHLRMNGLACVAAADNGEFQHLFQASREGAHVQLLELMQVACEPMVTNSSSSRVRESLESWLSHWVVNFEVREGRKPAPQDIRNDAEAAAKLVELSKLRKYDPKL
jgi:protein-L-isoaspartate O-methyltransferase